ncbi:MAG: sensor histidine kinase [Deltaproteobacteria bacterium]|nr:sensor histidine kinase [Deltaproteobacteria bacterium]
MIAPTVLAAALIGTSAPTAYYLLARRSLVREAELTARRAAAMVTSIAQERPDLWRYDTLKLLGDLREYVDQPDVAAVVLLDELGRDVPLGGASHVPESPAWGTAPVFSHDRRVGTVGVALDGRSVDRLALAMLAVFLALGIALSREVYRRGVRTVEEAEARIRELVRSLETARLALKAELGDAQSHLEEVMGHSLELREAERTRIARDLHDGVGQVLCGLRLRLDLLAQDLPEGELRSQAQETIRLVEAATNEVRRASMTLAAPPPEHRDLRGAIETMCERVATDQFSVRLDVGSLDGVPAPVATACYRILQEALANAARHASAQSVDVEVGLDAERGELFLTVRDEGRGFDPAAVRGLGLDGMQARALALGGRLDVQSSPGAGCTIRAILPGSGP